MNPVLLKPNSDMGFPGDNPRKGYREYEGKGVLCLQKEGLGGCLHESYSKLSGEFDLIVIERQVHLREVNLKGERHRKYEGGGRWPGQRCFWSLT